MKSSSLDLLDLLTKEDMMITFGTEFLILSSQFCILLLQSFALYNIWSNKPLTPDIAFSSLALVNQLAPPVLCKYWEKMFSYLMTTGL